MTTGLSSPRRANDRNSHISADSSAGVRSKLRTPNRSSARCNRARYARREARCVGVEPLQERHQELLGVFGPDQIVGLRLGLGSVQRAEFGVDVEESVLAGEQRGIVGIRDLREAALLGDQLAQGRRRRVVAEQVVAQRRVHAIARLACGVESDLETRQVHAAMYVGHHRSVVLVRPDPHQRRAAFDLCVGHDRHRRHPTGDRRRHRRLHLHRLEHGDRVADEDVGARFDERADHERRPTGPEDRAVLTVDRVARRIQLDTEPVECRGHDEPVTPIADRQPPLERVERIDRDVGDVGPVANRVAVRADTVDVEQVALSEVAELEPGSHGSGLLRSPCARPTRRSSVGRRRDRSRRPRPRRRATRRRSVRAATVRPASARASPSRRRCGGSRRDRAGRRAPCGWSTHRRSRRPFVRGPAAVEPQRRPGRGPMR